MHKRSVTSTAPGRGREQSKFCRCPEGRRTRGGARTAAQSQRLTCALPSRIKQIKQGGESACMAIRRIEVFFAGCIGLA